jgi:hypothetical protein
MSGGTEFKDAVTTLNSASKSERALASIGGQSPSIRTNYPETVSEPPIAISRDAGGAA